MTSDNRRVTQGRDSHKSHSGRGNNSGQPKHGRAPKHGGDPKHGRDGKRPFGADKTSGKNGSAGSGSGNRRYGESHGHKGSSERDHGPDSESRSTGFRGNRRVSESNRSRGDHGPRKHFGNRGEQAGHGGPDRRRDDERGRSETHDAASFAPNPADPPLPKDFEYRELSRGIRAELKGLSASMAKVVGGHLLMAGELLEEDPELALKHAEAARRYGSRLPVVREAVGETAYAAGEFSTALNEYRTLYRMSGDENYLPVIADCERAIGKPNLALETLAKADTQRMETAQLVEAKLVQAGARADLGQTDEALRLLKAAVSSGFGGRVGQARLHYAYADLLERSGDEEHARDNFRAVTRLDPADDLGAAEKLDELDGVGFVLEDDPDEEITEDDLQETEDTDAAGLMGQAPKSPTPDDSEADADD